MNMFRAFLALMIVVIAVYTAIVIANHGMGLLPTFFGDIAAMTWPGQFNLDFFCFLLLSGLWTAWRNAFSVGGLVLGLIAVFGGLPFLAAYLIYLSYKTDGNINEMLLGASRV